MPLYDLMLLLDPAAPSDRQESILRDVQTMLEGGGSLVGTQDWGTRRMAFEIDHHPDAAYHLYQFETAAGGALLEQVDHSLKIMDGVLRHRIIRLKDGTPPPPMPRPEGRSYSEGDAAPVDGDASGAPAADGAPADAAAAAAPADAAVPADGAAADAAAAPETSPEAGQPADAPATAGTAAAEQPAAPADAPAPAPAETPPPPDPADESAGPAGGGGDDEAPSGPTAA